MPLKCRNCSKIVPPNTEDVECEKGGLCDLQKVEVIHLMHPDGTGKYKGKYRQTNPETGNIESISVAVACGTTAPFPQMTTARHAATCLACLATIPAPEVNDDETSQEDLDTLAESVKNMKVNDPSRPPNEQGLARANRQSDIETGPDADPEKIDSEQPATGMPPQKNATQDGEEKRPSMESVARPTAGEPKLNVADPRDRTNPLRRKS